MKSYLTRVCTGCITLGTKTKYLDPGQPTQTAEADGVHRVPFICFRVHPLPHNSEFIDPEKEGLKNVLGKKETAGNKVPRSRVVT